jgi:signal transduction histidine kinase
MYNLTFHSLHGEIGLRAIALSVLALGKNPVLRDIQEICLYDVLAQIIGGGLHWFGISNSYFLMLTNAIIILKVVRLCWRSSATADAPDGEWPTFGLLGLWRHRHAHPVAYSALQKGVVYAAILLTLPIGFGTQALAKAIHFPVIEPLCVAFVLLFARPFLTRMEAEEAERLQAIQARADMAVALEDRCDEIAVLHEQNQTLLVDLERKTMQQQHVAHDLCNRVMALDSLAADFLRGVERMIELANMDKPPPPPVLAFVDLRALVDSFWYTETEYARSCHVALQLQAMPLIAQSDSQLVARIILNLLDNAIHTAPPGTRVRLRIAPCQTPAGAACRVQVRDSGAGLPFADGRNRHDNFIALLMRQERQSVDSAPPHTPALARPGHGLGLKSVYALCNQLGLSMALFSRVGRGTVFSFVLPLAASAAAEQMAALPPQDGKPGAGNPAESQG